MSSACVCHTEEYCFYCEMYVPLEKERDFLMCQLEIAVRTMESQKFTIDIFRKKIEDDIVSMKRIADKYHLKRLKGEEA